MEQGRPQAGPVRVVRVRGGQSHATGRALEWLNCPRQGRVRDVRWASSEMFTQASPRYRHAPGAGPRHLDCGSAPRSLRTPLRSERGTQRVHCCAVNGPIRSCLRLRRSASERYRVPLTRAFWGESARFCGVHALSVSEPRSGGVCRIDCMNGLLFRVCACGGRVVRVGGGLLSAE